MYRALRIIVATAFLAAACEPPSVSAPVELDEITLTAESPVVAFEVTACVTGEPPNALDITPSFHLVAFTNEGSVELTLETLAAEPSEEPYDPHIDEQTVRSDDGYGASIDLVSDADWRSSGTRCAEPEVVQISVPALAEGQEVNIVNLSASLSAQWAGGACGGDFEEDWLSLEVVRL